MFWNCQKDNILDITKEIKDETGCIGVEQWSIQIIIKRTKLYT